MSSSTSKQRWYYRLKQKSANDRGALLAHYTEKDLIKKFLVSYENKGTRMFSLFENFLDFYNYQEKQELSKRCYYELIVGDGPQKPHFDIDVKLSENPDFDNQRLIDELTSAIIEVFNDLNLPININNITYYSSHGVDKMSYHVIIDKWYQFNNRESKEFYSLVTAKMSEEYSKLVDPAVYSKLQQFRILGNHKAGSDRIKIIEREWYYYDDLIEYNNEAPEESLQDRFDFARSLVTNIADCQGIPSLISNDKSTGVTNLDKHDLSRDDARKAIEMIAERANISISSVSFPYRIRSIEGNMVVLNRVRASICPICDRRHDNENPFLTIVGEQRKVYFNCRRDRAKRKLLIGELGPDPEAIEELLQLNTLAELKRLKIEEMENENEIEVVEVPIKNKNTGLRCRQTYTNTEADLKLLRTITLI